MSLHFGPVLVLAPSPRVCREKLLPKYQEELRLSPKWRCDRDMPIERKDITIVQHDDMGFFFFPLDSNNNALDISGFQSFSWIIADSVTGVIYLNKSTAEGTILKPSAFSLSVVLPKVDTGSLPITTVFPEIRGKGKSLYHEMKGLNSSGQQQTMLRGKVYVEDTRISD